MKCYIGPILIAIMVIITAAVVCGLGVFVAKFIKYGNGSDD